MEDIQNANWVCRSCWIDSSLPTEIRPSGIGGNETLEGIEILWNDRYKDRKELFERYQGNKEEFLGALEPVLNEMIYFAERATQHFEEYEQEKITEEKFVAEMQRMDEEVTELYHKSGDLPFPPPDCEDYDRACQNIFATVSNMFLYYSKKGLEKWPNPKRDWLMQEEIDRFHSDLEKVKFEKEKIHHA